MDTYIGNESQADIYVKRKKRANVANCMKPLNNLTFSLILWIPSIRFKFMKPAWSLGFFCVENFEATNKMSKMSSVCRQQTARNGWLHCVTWAALHEKTQLDWHSLEVLQCNATKYFSAFVFVHINIVFGIAINLHIPTSMLRFSWTELLVLPTTVNIKVHCKIRASNY